MKKLKWLPKQSDAFYKQLSKVIENTYSDIDDIDNMLMSMLAIELNEYVQAITELETNGSTITVKGANGYSVTKQSPAVQTKQAAFKNIIEILTKTGLLKDPLLRSCVQSESDYSDFLNKDEV
ncbi:P27 family phage terminase small subunit [Shewanella sp. MM_2022_3]|uniref:P27 family phage terminase small subunit n=1 Tax=Shewanella sp. MM_2022_3 TaxID=2923280 RepID=UPI001F4BDB33|nr:P27 family phage terminase small subunit [Shewanella sp. MM_2022_3]MCH7421471.1 P27 family phage terminase small subunit [Shewanella sp. MM_2022_3]